MTFADLWSGNRSRRIASDPFDLVASARKSLMRALLDALDCGATLPGHAADNRRPVPLILAGYEPHESGRAVALDY